MTGASIKRNGPSLKLVGVVLGLTWMLLVVSQAGAASGRATAGYSAGAVTRAFSSHGIKLYNANPGTSSQVQVLASTKPHDGWNVGVYVYPNEKGATSAYAENVKSWLRSGMAATKVKNVVVAVVRTGVKLSAKPKKRWPMPQVVVSVIAAFSK